MPNLDIITFPLYDKPIRREDDKFDPKNEIPVLQFNKLDSGLYKAGFEWTGYEK